VHSLRAPAGTPAETANRQRLLAAADVLPIGQGDDVILLDGDGTLTAIDTTKAYAAELGLSWQDDVKPCFSAASCDYGGFGDFQRLATQLDLAAAAAADGGAGAAEAAARKVELDAAWVQWLCSLPPGCGPRLVLLTAGRREVWERVLQTHGLAGRVSLLATGAGYVVDKRGKAAVARLLQQKAGTAGTQQVDSAAPPAVDRAAGSGRVQQRSSRPLLCVGDSLVDLPMLSVPGVEPLVLPRRTDLLQAVAELAAAGPQGSRAQLAGGAGAEEAGVQPAGAQHSSGSSGPGRSGYGDGSGAAGAGEQAGGATWEKVPRSCGGAGGKVQAAVQEEGLLPRFKQLLYPDMPGRVQACSLPDLTMEQLAVSGASRGTCWYPSLGITTASSCVSSMCHHHHHHHHHHPQLAQAMDQPRWWRGFVVTCMMAACTGGAAPHSSCSVNGSGWSRHSGASLSLMACLGLPGWLAAS
jgi:hypothetical protein